MIKLIATDMDGTFLAEDGTYNQEQLAALLPKLAEKAFYLRFRVAARS